MLTEKFARTGTDVFLAGVAYTGCGRDDFYSVGEAGTPLSFAAGGQTVRERGGGGIPDRPRRECRDAGADHGQRDRRNGRDVDTTAET
jgi:hypothetical protein